MTQAAAERKARLVHTEDPWDSWVPSLAERSHVRSRLPAGRPLSLVTITRARRLAQLQPYERAVSTPWQLTVVTDVPRRGSSDVLWSPERAHDLVAAADCLLIVSEDGTAAPIRLISGLRCGCPVLSSDLASYRATASHGEGWLAITDAADLAARLARFAEHPKLLADLGRAASDWRYRAKAPDAVAAWLGILS
jgi:glycosyltransferase involved in cell wall biosynthesis